MIYEENVAGTAYILSSKNSREYHGLHLNLSDDVYDLVFRVSFQFKSAQNRKPKHPCEPRGAVVCACSKPAL